MIRLLSLLALTLSLSGCAVTDTAKDVYTSLSTKVSGVLSSSSENQEPQSLPTERIILETLRGDLPLTVEVADSADEREIGLMYREVLPLGTGMLFVFDDEAPRNFWMKNTLVPLDIIYFSSKMQVTSMVESMLPCDESTTNQLCALYPSGSSAMYALEVPAGFIQANSMRVGDQMIRGN